MDLVLATYNIAGAVCRTNRIYGRLKRTHSSELTAIARRSLPEIAQVLRDTGADIITLQEVDTCFDGSHVVRQWEVLADELGMNFEFTPSLRVNMLGAVKVRTGVATLTRRSISASRRVDFEPRFVSRKARLKSLVLGRKAALHTRISLDGRTLHVVNAHLTHDVTRQREYELAALLDYCADLDPVLLMGDLNLTPPRTWASDVVHPQPVHDECMSVLRTFVERHPGLLHYDARLGSFAPAEAELDPICTSPVDSPRYKFDYIFLLTRDPSVSLGPETVLDVDASDHRPVVATLRIG